MNISEGVDLLEVFLKRNGWVADPAYPNRNTLWTKGPVWKVYVPWHLGAGQHSFGWQYKILNEAWATAKREEKEEEEGKNNVSVKYDIMHLEGRLRRNGWTCHKQEGHNTLWTKGTKWRAWVPCLEFDHDSTSWQRSGIKKAQGIAEQEEGANPVEESEDNTTNSGGRIGKLERSLIQEGWLTTWENGRCKRWSKGSKSISVPRITIDPIDFARMINDAEDAFASQIKSKPEEETETMSEFTKVDIYLTDKQDRKIRKGTITKKELLSVVMEALPLPMSIKADDLLQYTNERDLDVVVSRVRGDEIISRRTQSTSRGPAGEIVLLSVKSIVQHVRSGEVTILRKDEDGHYYLASE